MDDSGAGSGISRKLKVILYVVAWLLALFATDPDLGLWSLAWMFPIGLAEFVDHRTASGGGWGIFGACVAVYLLHGYFFFRSKRRAVTWVLYAVLIALLVCNAQGCRNMIHAH